MEQYYKLYRVRELADGDESFVSLLAKTFLEEVPADAKILKEAVENENYLAAYQVAHKMKPTIDMFELGVLDCLIEVQDWGKFEKKDVNILPHLKVVLAAIDQASKEIRADFKI
ncbi:Hpt domain-containing protein [Oceanihabitans sediminis]|uniref:Hpt domain-containing protein n=1 Tax=Oceanihabitans sediminis TaxID=1812012 RepID=A0A368P4Z1_9FLAO|nr:Hpt domain-containing protein [Oceanihabitans sediminis]MDX1278109.1 Hpt domain-containing protein [Oceanihabitans sediminis]MDX1774384.1 Hpt domain-containing protein [Oceanihabitans sediminis]RBP29813.1 hypothetical protein DFR65_10537 [Oceanihabitans sediminis]RCU57154.1 Hpt domain-containing protein [Oceanihabitans sediminis]